MAAAVVVGARWACPRAWAAVACGPAPCTRLELVEEEEEVVGVVPHTTDTHNNNNNNRGSPRCHNNNNNNPSTRGLA